MISSVLLLAARRSSSLYDLDGAGLLSVLGIGVVVIIVAFIETYIKRKKAMKNQKMLDNRAMVQYNQWQKMISMTGELEPIETSLLLKDGEECLYFAGNVFLFEVRSVRHSSHTFGTMPLGKTGIRLGKGWSTSESSDEWRPIAQGQFYVTNKQVYFDGDKQDRKIPLNKITTIKSEWTAVEISSDKRQKSMVFVGLNGKICDDTIRLIRNEQ